MNSASPRKIAITGASGLIGGALVGHLRAGGDEVLRLVRRKPVSTEEVFWNPVTGEVDLAALDGVQTIIHLAGANVGDKRWSAKYRAEILNSRLLGTQTIASAVNSLSPELFISASAIGYYGETGNRSVTEIDRPGDDFLATVCKEWEAASANTGAARTVTLRTGLVLDPTGGALGRMLPIFKLGAGGKLGNGRQWWSWITLHDQLRAIEHIISSQISGPLNLTSPNPATNQEFTAALARALHRPALLPAPALALKVALGGFSIEILGSKKVLPTKLLESGFEFEYPHLVTALEQLVK